MSSTSVFARREEKYLISYQAADALISLLGTALTSDSFNSDGFKSITKEKVEGSCAATAAPVLINNLYLDTPERLLIRRSIEKPRYKEKLRVRTYGKVCEHGGMLRHEAFVELKKKFDGQTYKRRAQMSLGEAKDFLETGSSPATNDPLREQILRELSWAISLYAPLTPFMNIRYERCAYKFRDTRITMDCNVNWAKGSWENFFVEKCDNPRLQDTRNLHNYPGLQDTRNLHNYHALQDTHGLHGNPGLQEARSLLGDPEHKDNRAQQGDFYQQLLPKETCIMEIKTTGALPLELSSALSNLHIFPTSFSKVGRAYEASMLAQMHSLCATNNC
ncbi:MAG: polyphosphate polymerase domain-containing protein [Coriobacteriales bacterium]|nr:polyphosphate polymerase domain-containing protein [Coriobacteriales bacterium]